MGVIARMDFLRLAAAVCVWFPEEGLRRVQK